MVNFAEALDTKTGDIERPPLLPVGHYEFLNPKVPEISTVGADDEWDLVEFNLQIVRPLEDLKNATARHAFLFDKNDEQNFNKTLYSLKRFCLEHLQVEAKDSTPLKELLNNTVNKGGICQIFHKPDKEDKELFHANIKRTGPLD